MYTLCERSATGDWTVVCRSTMQGCKIKAERLNRSETGGNLGREFLIRRSYEDLLRSVSNAFGRMEWEWAGKQNLGCFSKKESSQRTGRKVA